MNERIKELAYRTCSESTLTGDESFSFSTSQLEKFAELIVKECTEVCQQEWYDLNNKPAILNDSPRNIGFNVGQKAGTIKCIALVKKHFEIKE